MWSVRMAGHMEREARRHTNVPKVGRREKMCGHTRPDMAVPQEGNKSVRTSRKPQLETQQVKTAHGRLPNCFISGATRGPLGKNVWLRMSGHMSDGFTENGPAQRQHRSAALCQWLKRVNLLIRSNFAEDGRVQEKEKEKKVSSSALSTAG